MHGAAGRLEGGSDVTLTREIVPFPIQTFHFYKTHLFLSPALYINLIRIPKQRYSNTDIIRDDKANYMNILTSTEETKSHFTEI